MANTKQVEVPAYLQFSKIIVWFLHFWVIIGAIALFLRVFLLAFSANPTTWFVDFVYRVSSDYLAPFRGIFPPREVGDTGYLDVAAIFAIIIYLFIAWGFQSLIEYIQRRIDISKAEQAKTLKAAQQK